MILSAAEYWAIRRSRIFLVLATPIWCDDAQAQARTQAQTAYAQQCGTPVRVLVSPGVRLPETAFQGLADVQIVRSQGSEADGAQIEAWLEEVAPCSR